MDGRWFWNKSHPNDWIKANSSINKINLKNEHIETPRNEYDLQVCHNQFANLGESFNNQHFARELELLLSSSFMLGKASQKKIHKTLNKYKN